MPAAPRFSIGIPTYNQADYLEATLESVLTQTHPADEIVVSDHFSTDRTPQILARYAAAGKIRAVQPPAGANVGAQWQFTLSALTGDWVTLFSSDDLAHPRFVEVLLRGAARRPDAVLVRAGWENIDPTGNVVSKEFLLSVAATTEFPANLLEQKYGPKASFAAFAVKREPLIASGGYPIGMESFGDWPMFAQLAPYGSFIYENEIIAGYRIGHDGNKFRRRLGMWLRDEERMFYDVLPRAAEKGGLDERAWIEEASRSNFLRYLEAASKEFKPDEREEIVPLFTAWAARTGCASQLARFASGENVLQPVSLRDRAKNMLRPHAQRLYASLKRS